MSILIPSLKLKFRRPAFPLLTPKWFQNPSVNRCARHWFKTTKLQLEVENYVHTNFRERHFIWSKKCWSQTFAIIKYPRLNPNMFNRSLLWLNKFQPLLSIVSLAAVTAHLHTKIRRLCCSLFSCSGFFSSGLSNKLLLPNPEF